MSVSYPSRIGGVISAFDSDSISNEIAVSGLPIGTKVWNEDVGSFFKLTISTASLVTDEVLEVLGITGARWIVESTGGFVESVTAQTSNAIDNADPVNPVVKNATSSNAGLLSAADKASFPVGVAGALSGGNTISFGTLDGDNDGDYEIEFDLICLTNAPGQIYLKINGNTTNQSSAFLYFFASANGSTLDPGLSIYSNGGTARVTGFIRLTSKTGKWRSFFCVCSDGTPNMVVASGNYKDSVTNITGVSIVTANANALDAGSSAKLRKQHKA
jgi:hypothetical protein